MRDFWRGLWRMAVFLSLIALLAPFQIIFYTQSLPLFFHRVMARVLNIKITQEGRPFQALLVSNHISWVDILVLGSRGHLSFIAKSEVANWPLFGWLAKMQQTLFVERNTRLKVVETLKEIKSRLRTTPLVLFGEGTTSNGSCVLPFMSSLIFAPAQPVVIYYEEVEQIAWHGEMTLLPHFWEIFKRKETRVKVVFLEVLLEGNRKEIALRAETQVREIYEKCLKTDKNGLGAA